MSSKSVTVLEEKSKKLTEFSKSVLRKSKKLKNTLRKVTVVLEIIEPKRDLEQ